MISLNAEVRHTTFGIGYVVDLQGKYMRIKFASVEKTFVYPDAFEKYLTLSDGTVSNEILEDIREMNKQKQAIIGKKVEERLHTMTHGKVLPGKEVQTLETDDPDSRLKNTEPEEL